MTYFTVRRKSDKLYLTGSFGHGRIVQFDNRFNPKQFDTRSKAVAVIRVDMGDDLEKYQIEERNE